MVNFCFCLPQILNFGSLRFVHPYPIFLSTLAVLTALSPLVLAFSGPTDHLIIFFSFPFLGIKFHFLSSGILSWSGTLCFCTDVQFVTAVRLCRWGSQIKDVILPATYLNLTQQEL